MKNQIINHLLETLNKEMDADWWAKYLEMLFELAEERVKQPQDSSLVSTEEPDLGDVDDSIKPLLTDLSSIFNDMNSVLLESNERILKDIQTAAASGNMDREDLEEIIASLPTDAVLTKSEETKINQSLNQDVLKTLKESLPEDHTLANTETVKILQAAEGNREEHQNI
ncbi:hypothetical protein [Bacillus swezeyi]|uniref:hypothetical protein n=1 Tax=Bacillus swezeyi TaxID=1925020 RepID=UPI0027DE2A96|nr:hypothetical protein [Bacillus swezeyi]